MSKTAIVTDENSGLNRTRAEELGIFLMPMPFFVNGEIKFEDVDMTKTEFYKALSEDADVSTSQPSPGDVMDLWTEILKEYDDLVYIPMSSGLSASCQSAKMFAEDFDGRVSVVDNHRISVTMERSVLDALTLRDKGFNACEIAKKLEEDAYNASIYITVENLKYLKKGGRITPAGAAIGAVLNIKPVLKIEGGKLDAYAKERGMKKARHTMVSALQKDFESKLKEFVDKDEIQLCISYSDVDDETLQGWVDEVKAAFPGRDIMITPLSLSIGCHIGPGALAVAAAHVIR
ncbi:MAG: DegV family protein [Acetatifactor sp.]|nr:DegV family protein [Acetatifactor sp.]